MNQLKILQLLFSLMLGAKFLLGAQKGAYVFVVIS
jgi:hypothetical protein